ncbi:hypothetical protein TrST_g6000 [Triparma strigata]|uniref:Uncharacterized protein n=1 Tax=Triparma strigata TaxID=1606541 RepID=A0A9W7BB73_9STRA|nr:hypothetical protein TrST_g6000 [Triparma strigata]
MIDSSSAFISPYRVLKCQINPIKGKSMSSMSPTILAPQILTQNDAPYDARRSSSLGVVPPSLSTLIPSAAATLIPAIPSSLLPPKPLIPSLINSLLFALSTNKISNHLTPSGLVHAFILASGLSSFGGWTHWSTAVCYFTFGVSVTKFRMSEKTAKGIAEGRRGRRGPENVWGSAAVALVCSLCSAFADATTGECFRVSKQLWELAFVSAFATKLADTFASEIGKGFGKTTFLITTLKKVDPGTEGAVSAEGTAAAVVGGALLAAFALALGVINSKRAFMIATVAAFFATNIESVIGATIQKGWMTNEVVNFVNTLVGAVTAIGLATRFGI